MNLGVIRDEDDIIIIGDSTSSRIVGSLFMISFGTLWLFIGIFNDSGIIPWPSWIVFTPSGDIFSLSWFVLLFLRIFAILLGGLFFWGGLYMILVNESVTLDKKLRSVVIIHKSIIERLNSINEIPFSNIIKIEIERWTSAELSDSWHVNLITTQGKSMSYYASDESSAETIAEKIHKMTEKGISRIIY